MPHGGSVVPSSTIPTQRSATSDETRSVPVGVLIAWGVALVGTIVILKITDLITGFRASKEHEVQGLDVTQHGEEAYYLDA